MLLPYFSYITKLNVTYQGQIIHGQGAYCDSCPNFDEETFLKIENERSFIYREGNQRFHSLQQKAVYYLSQISAICKKKGIDFVVALVPDELQNQSTTSQTSQREILS